MKVTQPGSAVDPAALQSLDLSTIELAPFWGDIADAVEGESCLILAVSGGPDSLSMLLGFATLAAKGRLVPRLIVATVNHGLRAEAEEDVRLVEAVAERLSLPCMAERVSKTTDIGNVQAWARDVRYERLVRIAETEGGALVTAHTLDDQAETVLMRAARGTGAAGLSAMLPVSNMGAVRVLRPFLRVKASALRSILEGLPISAASDPSNQDPAYTRVRFRNWLRSAPSPDGRKALSEGLANSATILAYEHDALMHYARLALENLHGLSCGFAVGALDLTTPHPVLARSLSLVLKAVSRKGGKDTTPSLSKMSELARRLSDEESGHTVIGGAAFDWRSDPTDHHRHVLLTAYAEAGRSSFPSLAVGPRSEDVWDGRFRIINGTGETVQVAPWSGRMADLTDRETYGAIAQTMPVVMAQRDGCEPTVVAVPSGAEPMFAIHPHPTLRIDHMNHSGHLFP